MKHKPGDKIIIKINGKEIETFIDESGFQRLPHNKIIGYLTRHDKTFFDYNELWDMVGEGLFSMDDARLIYQNNGYTVCGYSEIFDKDKIENPLWEKKS